MVSGTTSWGGLRGRQSRETALWKSWKWKDKQGGEKNRKGNRKGKKKRRKSNMRQYDTPGQPERVDEKV